MRGQWCFSEDYLGCLGSLFRQALLSTRDVTPREFCTKWVIDFVYGGNVLLLTAVRCPFLQSPSHICVVSYGVHCLQVIFVETWDLPAVTRAVESCALGSFRMLCVESPTNPMMYVHRLVCTVQLSTCAIELCTGDFARGVR